MATGQIEHAEGSRREPPHGRERARLVALSLARFPGLVAAHELRLRRGRLGQHYRLFDEHSYRVFRETVRPLPDHRRTVIEVRFRLRLVGSARLAHRLFQRLCILTTPFWSGFDGLGTKLWMLEPRTCDYAGIYDWGEADTARAYLGVLLPVLRMVSVPGSVAYELHAGVELDGFLLEREPLNAAAR